MAIVLVIFCILNTTHKNLRREDFAMVESRRYVNYPQGFAGYKSLVYSIKGKLTSKHVLKTAAENKNFHYYVYGCPPLLMTWYFECCFRMHTVYVKQVNERRPRMVNWKTLADADANTTMNAIDNTVFNLPGLQVDNLVPTEQEMEALPLAILQQQHAEREKLSSSAGTSVFRDSKDVDEEDDKWLFLQLEVIDLKKDYNSFKKHVIQRLDRFDMTFDAFVGSVKKQLDLLAVNLKKSASGGISSGETKLDAQPDNTFSDVQIGVEVLSSEHI